MVEPMNQAAWQVGAVWGDGVASGDEHLYFKTEGAAKEAFGVLRTVMDMSANARLSDSPTTVTVRDDFGSDLKLFGRLLRVVRIQELGPWREMREAEIDAAHYRRAYNEAAGREAFIREQEAKEPTK